METLSLNRKSKGYYSKTVGLITIDLSNPFIVNKEGSKAWQLNVLNDNDSLLNEWFKTKKEALKFGAKWVIENL